MHFFDKPRPKSRSNIALGGSSRTETSEELLAKAKKRREERAHTRLQHNSARIIQTLIRTYSTSHHLASVTLSSSSPASDVNHDILNFVMLAGLVNVHGSSVSQHVNIVHRSVHSRSFVIPLAIKLSSNYQTNNNSFTSISGPTVVKTVSLLFASALNILNRSNYSTNRNSNSRIRLRYQLHLRQQQNIMTNNNNDNDNSNIPSTSVVSKHDNEDAIIKSLVQMACKLLLNISDHSCIHLVKWGTIVHATDVIWALLVAPRYHLRDSLWPNIENLIVSLYKRANSMQDKNIGKLMMTQLSVAVLSIDGSVFEFNYHNNFDMFTILVHALARPCPGHSNDNDADGFVWDHVHAVKDLSMQSVAQMLSNVLFLADYAWAQKQGIDDIRWPLISVISTLIHSLPKDVWQLTTDDDDDDDDDDEFVDDVDMGEENIDDKKHSQNGEIQQPIGTIDADGDTKMYNTNRTNNISTIKNGVSSILSSTTGSSTVSSKASVSTGSNDGGRRRVPSTAMLKHVMTHVSTALHRMVSEESVKNIFAAAVSEGHAAVLCVCELFNFLIRRDRKLTIPLRNSLALWKRSTTTQRPSSSSSPSLSKTHILRLLWKECTMEVDVKRSSVDNDGIIDVDADDDENYVERKEVVVRPDAAPILSIFAATYAYLLYFQDVDEMFDSEWPFTIEEVGVISIVLKQQLFNALYVRNSPLMSVTVGTGTSTTINDPSSIITPASIFIDTSASLSSSTPSSIPSQPATSTTSSLSSRIATNKKSSIQFLRSEPGLLDDVARLLSRLHAVDSQRRFTSGNTFWEAHHSALSSDSFVKDAIEAGPIVLMRSPPEETTVTFGGIRQVRYRSGRQHAITGARELLNVAPYLVPFIARSKIFQAWVGVERDRATVSQMDGNGGHMMMMMNGGERTVQVRRKEIYEDAFRELNHLGEGLKSTVRVKFIDEHGLEEAGIDGGGVFKEFMHEVLEKGFSPYSYALFKSTPDGRIYPNPDAHIAINDFKTQFEFLGKLLGKAVFDGVLVDIPLAKFFRLKMLGEVNYPTDLLSMDPQLYKSLKFVKNAPSNEVEDLGITFTAVNDEFGASKEIELKDNGRNIKVTGLNRIEYIHRFAHYRMNVQIKEESEAFLKGFYEIVPSQFVRLFSHDELQLLISGKDGKIDITDWKRNTRYTGGYTENTNVIKWFWTVVEELKAEDQSKMLQFVTSSPRAPLLGFAYLVPGFCIHRAEGSVRLPTASTCMNLLKLPEYTSLQVVREKLIYALQANAGFDLS